MLLPLFNSYDCLNIHRSNKQLLSIVGVSTWIGRVNQFASNAYFWNGIRHLAVDSLFYRWVVDSVFFWKFSQTPSPENLETEENS